MRQKKEDSKTREKNLEEQLAAESSANQELQVRYMYARVDVLSNSLYSE